MSIVLTWPSTSRTTSGSGDPDGPLAREYGRAHEIDQEVGRRAESIFRERCQGLFATADRTVLFFLPLQWLLAIFLSAVQTRSNQAGGLCTAGLSFPMATLLGAVINAVPFVFARQGAGVRATRIALAVCMALFYALLVCIAAGRVPVHPYLFVALALLAFYRDWRLLALLALGALGTWSIYGTLVCGAPGASASFFENSLGLYAWVILEGSVLGLVCIRSMLMFRAGAAESAELECDRSQAHRELLERTRQLETSSEQYRALLESTSAVAWELDDTNGACIYIGGHVESQWGWPAERFRDFGFLFSCVHPDDAPRFSHALEAAVASQDVVLEFRLRLATGAYANVRSFIRAPGKRQARIVRGITIDITAQKKLEAELSQAQKLESVGRLAAGIAHEINTPVQFINDSCYFLKDAVAQTAQVLGSYREALQGVAAGSLTIGEALERVNAAEQAADVAFLQENMPAAADRSLEGLQRVADIVRSMKEFSHPHEDAPSSADLNAAIANTLTIARHEYKYVAEVVTHFSELPLVVCYVGGFNQALLNILVNAAHAIAGVVAGTEHKGLITVSSIQDGADVVVSVEDTGGGIPEEHQSKIFDPFFTTKEPGKGTGQGLAIARSIVVDKHGGSLTFETRPGVGTTFRIRLPMSPVAAIAR